MADKAKKVKKEVQPMFVDIDKAIDLFNENNPDKDPLTRKILAKELDLDYQTLVNYQGGRVPRAFGDLKKVLDRTGAEFSQIVKIKE